MQYSADVTQEKINIESRRIIKRLEKEKNQLSADHDKELKDVTTEKDGEILQLKGQVEKLTTDVQEMRQKGFQEKEDLLKDMHVQSEKANAKLYSATKAGFIFVQFLRDVFGPVLAFGN